MVVCASGSWRNHGINNVDDYLKTSYDPDVEFVDGVLLERNLGDWLHALIQSNVLFALRNKYPQLKVVAALRSRVAGTRYRLPDVCALLSRRRPGTCSTLPSWQWKCSPKATL